MRLLSALAIVVLLSGNTLARAEETETTAETTKDQAVIHQTEVRTTKSASDPLAAVVSLPLRVVTGVVAMPIGAVGGAVDGFVRGFAWDFDGNATTTTTTTQSSMN